MLPLKDNELVMAEMQKMEGHLLPFEYRYLFARAIIASTARGSSVFLSSYG